MNEVNLRVNPDKVASGCSPFLFGPYITVRPEPLPLDGAALVGRVLSSRETYGDLELVSGRNARLVPGDVIVGVLGNRAALRGFSGKVPEHLNHGDTLDLLNLGGVMGHSHGSMVGLGHPIQIEALGVPIIKGKPAVLSDHSVPWSDTLPERLPPVVIVAGTCMNAGKSTAAAVLIRHLSGKGLRVHAGKATGVAAIKDVLSFRDHGAEATLSFLECGVASTAYRKDVPSIVVTLLHHLSFESPDVIVLELGDGLMGSYGVDDIVADPRLASGFTGAVLAANDTIGAVAGVRVLREAGIEVRCVAGPATDNLAGVTRLEAMGIPAANIFREPEKFCRLVGAQLQEVKK